MNFIDFETGFLRDVKNTKYIRIYTEIIRTLEYAKFTHGHMLSSIGILKRHGISDVDHWGNTKYHDTPEIQSLYKERRKRLAAFRDFADNITSMTGFISKPNAVLIKSWMKPIRKKIGTRNTVDEMLAVFEIVVSTDMYRDLNAAMKEAKMLDFVAELEALNEQIEQMESNRKDYVSSAILGQERKFTSYRDLNMVLAVLNSVIVHGKEDSELAQHVGHRIDKMLRRERGYVRMVGTKKQIREGKEKGKSDGSSAEE